MILDLSENNKNNTNFLRIILYFVIVFAIIIMIFNIGEDNSMKIKRFAAILMCALLMLGVFPVSAFAAERTRFGMIDELEDSNNPGFISGHETALERIYEGYMAHSESISLYDLRIPVSDLRNLFAASIGVYPEIFFVDRGFSYSSSGNYVYALRPTYLYSAEEASAKLEEFYAKADEYLSYVDEGMDGFTKAVVLHDRLAINNAYEIERDGVYSSNYSFMVEGWGRCENYAECYAYLLAQVGIKSEIVNSDSMAHEWMRINIDGSDYYYNVDLTWDDPLYSNIGDRPDKVSHSYFLLSDEEFQQIDTETGRNNVHEDYEYINETGDMYDSFTNLHSLDNPMFYVNNALYTLYEANNKGYIATYNHDDDSFSDVLAIDDVWRAGTYSTWIGNFSGIGEYEDLLYYNGENCVYIYNPYTGAKEKYIDNALSDGNKLYGMYVSNGRIIGRAAPDPNSTPVDVDLGECKKRYSVNLEEEYIHGAVTADKQRAFGGETVTLNVVPDDGFVISSVWYNDTELTPDAQGQYSFSMPDNDAYISVIFDFADNAGAKLLGHSISLRGDIGVNFYMELSERISDDENAYMHFTIPSGADTYEKNVYVKDAERDGQYFVFNCNVAAKDMASLIKAEIIDGDGNHGTLYSYSVEDYANYLISNADENHPEYLRAKPLVEAMLEYGRHANVYFNSEETTEILNVTVPERVYTVTGMPSGVNFDGATLSLKSQTTLSLYFVKESSAGAVELTMDGKTEGVDYQVYSSGNKYVIRIPNIAANELNNSFTVKVNGTGSVTYSPMTYCYKAVSDDNTSNKLKNTVKALYLYWNEADNYFRAGGNNE